jgi:primosomal protein N' (replication factor Y)
VAYAEVSVNSPLAQRRTFSYAIPKGINIDIGQAVWVPFGDKILQGVVLEITDQPAVAETRDIAGLIGPALSPVHARLAQWISQHYLSPIFETVALMLPPGFERKAVTFVSTTTTPDLAASLTPAQREALQLMWPRDKVALKELEKVLGKKRAPVVVTQLVRRGLAARSYELEPVRIKAKIVPYLGLMVSAEQARQAATGLRAKRKGKQADLLEFLAGQPAPMPWAEVRQKTGSSKANADALADQGLVKFIPTEVRREPISGQGITPTPPPVLTTAQQLALESIQAGTERSVTGHKEVFLLHGVTGSGKTEVYLRALAETVKRGRRGIVLVPEIALTPQTIERFAARFPGRVAVLHSKLSLGEQFDEWQRISAGDFDVVIGSRSAVFAPQPDLGLIVIDEEQEWSYKQDTSPRYHARDVAIRLAEMVGAVVILGSATPDVESYYHAQTGDYHLLQLPERVTPLEVLPHVEIVDLREELKAGVRSLFSRSLSEATARAVNDGEQVLFFLNRRGGHTFIQCRHCGFVFRCRRCEVALTHHFKENMLVCHQCNYRMPVPEICPRCSHRRLKFLGIGTQKLEQEASFTFPQARLLRWDSDATRGKDAHQKIMDKFRSHEADILIGTQMIAKGLDIPLVTLVGVVSADGALNLPDFRAGERTFQLLSQVAGRAGRGTRGGQVIIQTYSPEHYTIQAAARHDYISFYSQEIEFRRQLHNPPFSRLACLVYSHTNDAIGQREAVRMARELAAEIASRGLDDLTLVGPAPAFIHRLRGKFRWQLVLRGSDPSALLTEIALPRGWSVDIDPVSLI